MADLGLGIVDIVGAIDVCFKVGKFLMKACKDYSQTDVKLNELSVRIQICWSRIASQLEIAKQLESGMTDEQRELQSSILHILQSKLDAATVAISKPDKYAASKRMRDLHFLDLRETLESTVVELESWQKRFEPSWYQVIKTAGPDANGLLRSVAAGIPRAHEEPARDALKFRRAFDDGQSVIIAAQTFHNLEKLAIPYCKAQAAIEQKDSKHYIIDTVSQETVNFKDARELAYRLRDSNPFTFGTLKCKGIVRLSANTALAFIFRVPDGYSKVQSVRGLLQSQRMPDSLTTRLEIARQLVTAVYYVHLYEFVHKNITPETILTLKHDDGRDGIVVCLVGFQLFRYADAKTNTTKADRKDNVYQHPSRLASGTVDFVMQHDIYSLGVCLLEIGLWQSFVDYDVGDAIQPSSAPQAAQNTLDVSGAEATKEHLIALSRSQLKVKMGDTYSRVVETCLTCFDHDNTEFGDPRDFEDEDGVRVGSRYVKKIMDAMSSLCY